MWWAKYYYTGDRCPSSSPQGQSTGVCSMFNCTLTPAPESSTNKMICTDIVVNNRTFRKKTLCVPTTITSVMTIIMQETITNTAIGSIFRETITASRPCSTTSAFPTTTFPNANNCGHLVATLHGVYMTVLLVLVAVTITMTTLVVYMCLMMRRAKSGRVPQTTTGTTHTNNMAASDYCEPISLRHFQNTNEGV